ncbi:hypothetical protein [Baaleninema simplex]|uniref:hypothetical protein n=1 Tax=Baaleninema simplex TaxID=2862350 RepID=UPI0003479706|nr:hypothetical protein [Baaleninema simplex]
MTESNSIEKVSSNELANDSQVFTSYLSQFGLPVDNIIASTEQRNILGQNIPTFLNSLSQESKQDARYLSKFVCASSIGLFDASLNYLWNEVVLNLRKKAVTYGVDIFFDAAVGGRNREDFENEDDLGGLKDIVLLDTCKKLELVSDIVHCKLNFIMTMRNEIAASHPNVEAIKSFELLGYLEICVKEVLEDQLSPSAIQIGALVHNLRNESRVLDQRAIHSMEAGLKNLSVSHVDNLLATVFGIFVASNTSQNVRLNVSKIAPQVWKYASERARLNTGVKLDGYRTNLHQEKMERGVDFLRLVDGLEYETLQAKVIAINYLAEQLKEKHEEWDNFHNEPPVMRDILQYCKSSSDIPGEVLGKLIEVVIQCRVGNGVSYKNGVSPSGKPLYNQFLSILDDAGVEVLIKSLFASSVKSRLSIERCRVNLRDALVLLKSRVISERLSNALQILIDEKANVHRVAINRDFRELTSTFIEWPPISRE